MSSTEISEQKALLSLYNDLGLSLKPLVNVGIPLSFLISAKTKYELFKAKIKENQHASVNDKLKSVFKKGTISKAESERRSNLAKAFYNVYPYMEQAGDYFSGCSNIDEIEDYCDKIRKAHKKLEKKGYVSPLKELEGKGMKFSNINYVFDFSKNDVNFNPKMSYEQQCGLLSSHVHQLFIAKLNELNEAYTEKYRDIEEKIGDMDSELNFYRHVLDESLKKYDMNVYKIKLIIRKHEKYFKKGGNRRAVERNLKQIDDTRNSLAQIVSAAKRIRLNAGFSYLKDQDAYKSLMDELQTINKWVNALDRCFNEGDIENIKTIYENFKRGMNKLSGKVAKFKESEISSYAELNSHMDSLKKYMENINGVIAELEKLKYKFEVAYKDYVAALKRRSPVDILNTVLALLAVFLPVTPLYNLVDKLARPTVDDADPFIPK